MQNPQKPLASSQQPTTKQMRDFKKYKVWEMGHQLTLEIYTVTVDFPSSEKFGLVSQIRRSAYSIPANFAEGSGKESEKEFNRFLQMSLGSANELEYFLILSADLNYLSKEVSEQLQEKIISIKKQLINLSKKLKEQ